MKEIKGGAQQMCPVDEELDDDAACCEGNSLEGIITTLAGYFATGKIIYADARQD